ncbi:helix-turn-helix domain-containing protein [Burkholderia cenocepacia]|uniref:helix-turn-helix transcriptional regulator n=1 Tax=Burkholderia cenocepacia TaxID=95486 RepID=UPI00223849F4|nr:helix-turn-helix domain-containing protein [Burkholderia cenocepacia]MCW5118602.1 helix-turn-helix domain-containing protein [Burkholderia cenocepacia]MCW5130913.1 helix-turn-helix domain-containing protein [Burkholderia cenocepacia]MCW5174055.1 helix-turn-helix domain-containing protein [Burkholderia cenocepacia]
MTTQGGAKRPDEAAKYLGISSRTLWRWVKSDTDFPKPFKLNQAVTLFLVSELDDYLARKAQGSRA